MAHNEWHLFDIYYYSRFCDVRLMDKVDSGRMPHTHTLDDIRLIHMDMLSL